MSHIVTHYLYNVMCIKQLASSVKILNDKLEKYKDDFDAIAFRGVSGTMIGPSLSIAMNKKMLVVRKGSSHSMYVVEGDYSAERYIIVDDFIASGATVFNIYNDIELAFKEHNKNNLHYSENYGSVYKEYPAPVCVGMAFFGNQYDRAMNIRDIPKLENFPVDGFFITV